MLLGGCNASWEIWTKSKNCHISLFMPPRYIIYVSKPGLTWTTIYIQINVFIKFEVWQRCKCVYQLWSMAEMSLWGIRILSMIYVKGKQPSSGSQPIKCPFNSFNHITCFFIMPHSCFDKYLILWHYLDAKRRDCIVISFHIRFYTSAAFRLHFSMSN